MISAIIGILGSIGMVVGAFISTGSLTASFDMPALLIVVALALFSTLGVSGKLPRGALIRHFGDAAVRAGWIGFLIGVIILCSMADPSSSDFVEYLLRAMAVATLTPLYGYGLQFLAKIAAPQG